MPRIVMRLVVFVLLFSCQTGVAQQSSGEAIYSGMSNTLPKHDYACFPLKRAVCASGDCKHVDLDVFFLLKRTGLGESGSVLYSYSRCDPKGCDMYDVEASDSGTFEILEPPRPSAWFFKRVTMSAELTGLNENEFLDVATLLLATYVSTGYCRDVK